MKFFFNSQTGFIATTLFLFLLVSVILAQTSPQGSATKKESPSNVTTPAAAASAQVGSGSKPSGKMDPVAATEMSPAIQMTTVNSTDNDSWILQSNWLLTTICGATILLGINAA